MIREKKIALTLKQLLKTLNDTNLTPDEVVILTGNFIYSIGAAIAGRIKNPPTLEELETSYMIKPTIDNFLMLTGINISARISPIEEERKGEKR